VTGTRQTANELERRTAAYPDEIADRLIKMFSVKGDTILDPFLGSGTTTKAAMQNERNSIGYETDPNLLPILTMKIGNSTAITATEVKIIKR
jgi:site-specific DNA-methyltransferase (cytosine-N4-specific)